MGGREVRQLSGDGGIDVLLSALADCRGRTLEFIERLLDADLDRGEPNTISSVLYHVAAIEADYLYDDVLGDIEALPMQHFPYDVREESGILTPVGDQKLADHLERLAAVRGWLVDAFAKIDGASFHEPRTRDHYDISPAYVLYHLTQHEAEHRAEIGRAMSQTRGSAGL